jgi:type III secretory pathway lipoprotein EscJ
MKRITITLLFLLLSACEEKIINDLGELEANRIKVTLASANIDSKKVREGNSWSISVDRSAVTKSLKLIEESRLLRRDIKSVAEQSKSLIPGKEERAYIRERQLAWNLEQTLERFPGVLEARVHLVLEPLDRLENNFSNKKPSASVLLLTSNNNSNNDTQGMIDEKQVKMLINGASGIDISLIAVVISHAIDRSIDSDITTTPNDTSDPTITNTEHTNIKTTNVYPYYAAGIALSLMLIGVVVYLSRKKNKTNSASKLEEERLFPKEGLYSAERLF